MQKPLRVLLVGVSDVARGTACSALRAHGYDVEIGYATGENEVGSALDETVWDLVFVGESPGSCTAVEVVSSIRTHDECLPCILLGDTFDAPAYIDAIRRGADDWIKSSDAERIIPALLRSQRIVDERKRGREAEAALLKSEARYQELVQDANDVIFTTDLQGNFTSLNNAGESISGYTREEILHLNMADVLTPQSLVLASEMIRQKLTDNKPTIYELQLVSRGGAIVPIEISTRLIFHGGVPTAIQGIARDITERKRAAEALRESDDRYRAIFENASDIVYTHDLSGRFTSINPATERITGYSREDILQLDVTSVVAPDHVERARDMIRKKLTEPGQTTYELDIIGKDGTRFPLELNSALIYREGVPVGVQGIARDISERRRTEGELRARERKQAAVAQLGQHALAASDLDAVFDAAVHRVVETLDIEFCSVTELLDDGQTLRGRAGCGWEPGVVGNTTIGAGQLSQAGYVLLNDKPVIVADLSAETRFSVPRVLIDHGVSSGIGVAISGGEKAFGVLSAFSTTHRAFTQDDVHFLQAVANVMTAAIERKRMEEERTRHSNELATRVIWAQEEERKRIARELHDETAQALSMLLMNLDLLEDHIPDDPPLLRSGFDRVRALARRTLDGTRALSHDLRPTILDDVGLVAALHWFAEEYQRSYGTLISVDAQGDPEQCMSPETEVALFRIAQESLTNSGKHAGASKIEVRLSCGPEMSTLIVDDNGRGFDPATVAGPTREGRLGLYGMQERVALLGGKLSVTTGKGQGTRVTAVVPADAGRHTGETHALERAR